MKKQILEILLTFILGGIIIWGMSHFINKKKTEVAQFSKPSSVIEHIINTIIPNQNSNPIGNIIPSSKKENQKLPNYLLLGGLKYPLNKNMNFSKPSLTIDAFKLIGKDIYLRVGIEIPFGDSVFHRTSGNLGVAKQW